MQIVHDKPETMSVEAEQKCGKFETQSQSDYVVIMINVLSTEMKTPPTVSQSSNVFAEYFTAQWCIVLKTSLHSAPMTFCVLSCPAFVLALNGGMKKKKMQPNHGTLGYCV